MDLDLRRIEEAQRVIDPVFQRSPQYVDPQLCRDLDRVVVVKDETHNPLHSFKGRGAGYLVAKLPRASHLVCASSGNFGQAIAYACRAGGHRCTVFLPAGANPLARERIAALGASVRLAAGADTKAEARRFAASISAGRFVEDGAEAGIAEGAGTIGLELRAAGPLDAVLVPVGDGALISGVGHAIKAASPSTRIVGVCPAAGPSMARSWRAGTPTYAASNTMADGLSIADPVPRSVARMREVVDDMVEVSEASLVAGMRLAARSLGTLLEPSGAAALAALLEHDVPGERVALVLTGSVLRPEHLSLMAPGRGTACRVVARLTLVGTPHPEQMVAEATRLVQPGGTVTFHEADPMTQALDPPLSAWKRLRDLLKRCAEIEGIDLFPGRRLPPLLQAAGLVDVEARVRVDTDPRANDRRRVFSDLLETLKDRLLAHELVAQHELDRLRAALRRHLDDRNTVVTSHFLVQVSGRKPDHPC
jgi:threonine dehydratase